MAANLMMDVLRKIQRDLAEQKDYMKNLHVIHTNINVKFNLMEGKLDQHQAVMEELKEQVRNNNTLLFGSDVLGIEYEDRTTMSYKNLDDTNGVEQSDKNLESNEASQVQTLNEEPSLKQTGQDDNKNNDSFQNSDSEKNAPRDSNTNESNDEIKELFTDFVKSAKRFYEETLPSVCQKEAPIPQTYFNKEQISQLNGELKQIMLEMTDIKELIREAAGKSNLPDEESGPTYAEQIDQLNSQLKQISEKYQFEMKETRELIKEIKDKSLLTVKKTVTPVRTLKKIQIPSFSWSRGYCEITELNVQLKKITEKYKDTNIFPYIEVVASLDQHPVMVALNRGVYLRNLKGQDMFIDNRVRWQAPILTQLKDKPDITLYEFIKENWGTIKSLCGSMVEPPLPNQIYTRYE